MTNAGLHAACARSVHARQRGSASSCAYQGPGTQTSSPPPLQCRPRCAPSCSSDPAWAPRGPRWGRPGTGPCAPRPPAWCNPHSSRWPAWASRNLFKSGARASACKKQYKRVEGAGVSSARTQMDTGTSQQRRGRACKEVQWRDVSAPRRTNATGTGTNTGRRAGPGVFGRAMERREAAAPRERNSSKLARWQACARAVQGRERARRQRQRARQETWVGTDSGAQKKLVQNSLKQRDARLHFFCGSFFACVSFHVTFLRASCFGRLLTSNNPPPSRFA